MKLAFLFAGNTPYEEPKDATVELVFSRKYNFIYNFECITCFPTFLVLFFYIIHPLISKRVDNTSAFSSKFVSKSLLVTVFFKSLVTCINRSGTAPPTL